MAYRLGIDIGTTNTVASIAVDGSPVEMLNLGADRPQMRSALFLDSTSRMFIGDAAAARGAEDPSRLIMDPRRQLGTDKTAVVGGQEVTPEQATAAVIGFVRDLATRRQGDAPAET